MQYDASTTDRHDPVQLYKRSLRPTNKKLNVEKYECPSIALTAIALIWKW